MYDLDQAVYDALCALDIPVARNFPQDAREAPFALLGSEGGACHACADGREYLTERMYALTLYAPSPEQARALAAQANAALCALGLRRQTDEEGYDNQLRLPRRTLRYRALSCADGRVYQ